MQNLDKLDADNLRDHEDPLCDDYPTRKRAHYLHNPKRFGDLVRSFKNHHKAFRISDGAINRTIDEAMLQGAATIDPHKQNWRIEHTNILDDGSFDAYYLLYPGLKPDWW